MRKKKILKILLVFCLLFLVLIIILLLNSTTNNKKEKNLYKIITSENAIWENKTSVAKDEDFETIGIPSEILKKIKSKKDFDLIIKNYINRYEFLGASNAELQDYEIDNLNDCIIMNFKMNNTYEDLFSVILYLEDNSMEIVDIWSEDDWNDEESSKIDWNIEESYNIDLNAEAEGE